VSFPQGKSKVAITRARNSNNVKIVSATASREPILNDGEFQFRTFFIPILFDHHHIHEGLGVFPVP